MRSAGVAPSAHLHSFNPQGGDFFDQADIEHALGDAAERGVFVHALIAFTNRGGEKNLRKLEMRLLEKGITVARTSDDLARYHGR